MESADILTKEFGKFIVTCYEEQNKEYEGIILETIDQNRRIRSRLAKKTPKKPGYFAAFWEKDQVNKNRPFQDSNSPEALAIVIIDTDNQGIFTIPKEAAIEQGIVMTKDQIGKMALRFYPPWCRNLNTTAKATQKWQSKFFKDYSETVL